MPASSRYSSFLAFANSANQFCVSVSCGPALPLLMVQWLNDEQMPFCLVATKSDKLAPTKRAPAARAIARELELPESQPRVAYSSETGDGRLELRRWIGHAVDAGEQG